MSDSETDVSELAREVVDELDPGSTIGDKVILSRRQAIGLATGTLSLGALSGFGAGSAEAQEAAGSVGTESDPVAAELATVSFPSTNPFEIVIDDVNEEVQFNR